MTETHDGTRFIWRDRDLTTYGALGGALSGLQNEADASDLWNAYVEYLSRPTSRLGGKTAQEVAGSNIGYLMGYYGDEDRRRVYGLFPMASHPVFGHNFGRGTDGPSPDDHLISRGYGWLVCVACRTLRKARS